MYRIQWKRKAQKQLLKITSRHAEQIAEAVDSLAAFPECSNVKALTNHAYGYRLRVGRYRVFFNADTTVEIVAIEEVKKRDERTY